MTEDKYKHQKKYYQKNREELLKKNKLYREQPEIKEKRRQYREQYVLDNKEKIKKDKRTYYQNNKEKFAEYRAQYKINNPKKYLVKPIQNCLWCKKETKNLYCSDNCEEKVKSYKKRFLPLFVWRFYSKYKVYKVIYEKIPKYRKLIFKTLPKKILRLLYIQGHRKLKYIILDIIQYRIRTATVCRHLIIHKKSRHYNYGSKIHHGRAFCSAQCRLKYKVDLEERRKIKNLVSWGTKERPDKETRRKISNQKWLIYNKERRKIDPAYKLITRMRIKTKRVLKKNPAYRRNTNGIKLSIYETLCIKDGRELKQHFESLWQPGMSWDNYGTGKEGWVCDHIIPLKYFMKNYDLVNDMEARRKAFGKDNLQPLWWLDNAKKAAKLNYEVK